MDYQFSIHENSLVVEYSFVEIILLLSPGLTRGETGDLVDDAHFSNPIFSLKQWLNGLKFTN